MHVIASPGKFYLYVRMHLICVLKIKWLQVNSGHRYIYIAMQFNGTEYT